MSETHELDQFSTSHLPLYLQVQQTLKEMIEDVEFGPGEQIPSERELSDMLGVSRMTVRRAVENLIQMGLLERHSTSGTYIRQPVVIRHVGSGYSIGLTQLLEEEGAKAGARLLDFEQTRAARKVAAHLQLRIGEPVVKIRRLRLVNGLPFCIETSYISTAQVPGLEESDLVGDVSLYALLKKRYGLDLIRSEGTVKISRCLEEEADLLDLAVGDPVLFMRAVVCDAQDQCVEYLKSVNHPDRVAFRTHRYLDS
jgi:GntR family transcriptional regulator